MGCFVTGATGFIGRYLVRELLAREDTQDREIFVLVRRRSAAALEELRRWWGPEAARVVTVEGDLGARSMGVNAAEAARLRGSVQHLYHLGAVYDLQASPESMQAANVGGTRHALEFARAVDAGCFHLVSSIASAGLYRGVFTEDMFEQAYGLDHPYFRTKHESEGLVRRQAHTRWRVYRPGMVVGDSGTGHITKIDGPYYFFKFLQMLRNALPSWAPLIGFEGGYVNVVPVDYVARALAHLSHAPGFDGRCFQITDPEPRRAGELLNLFARAAHGPVMSVRVDPALIDMIPSNVTAALDSYPPVQLLIDEALSRLRIPRSVLQFLNLPTLFDNVQARALLEPAGIQLPRLEDYAWRLWDYWERHLDPDLSLERSLERAVRDKRVLITGGAAGIGHATALRLSDAGAQLLIVDRVRERLEAVHEEISRRGGRVAVYECDLTDADAVSRLITDINAQHGGVDVLINNAGHSIRRSVGISYDRLHDYERLISLNYIAAVRLTLAFLPGMAQRRSGHVIAVSSIGVLANQPRFSAYIASKAALEAFTRSASSEYRDQGVAFTVINLPLVRTGMISPTGAYSDMRVLTADQAAERIVSAIVHRPARSASPLGRFAQWLELMAPDLADIVNNAAFHMYPDSAAARGVQGPDAPPTAEALRFQEVLRHLHWR